MTVTCYISDVACLPVSLGLDLLIIMSDYRNSHRFHSPTSDDERREWTMTIDRRARRKQEKALANQNMITDGHSDESVEVRYVR